MIEDKINKILLEINEDIAQYKGDNYFEDGLLDSLNFVDLVAEINDEFNINIPTKYLSPIYFKNKDEIIKLINTLLEK